MKQFILVISLLIYFTGYSQGVSLSEARAIFFSAGKDPSAMLRLYKLMNVKGQNLVPVLLAYRGASTAASSGEVNGVLNKFNLFKRGKADLEQAILFDPKNPEIRFLRLATQTNAPGFLFYKSDIVEDKKIVLEGLPGILAKETDRPTAMNIAKSLSGFKCLSAREKQIVNQLSMHYEQNN